MLFLIQVEAGHRCIMVTPAIYAIGSSDTAPVTILFHRWRNQNLAVEPPQQIQTLDDRK